MKFITRLERNGGWQFHPLVVGKFTLSIQASNSHYCTPRQELLNAGDYSAFEVAIFEGDSWINPTNDERFESLESDLKGRWDSSEHSVGAYIPAELVQRLYDLCEEVQA